MKKQIAIIFILVSAITFCVWMAPGCRNEAKPPRPATEAAASQTPSAAKSVPAVKPTIGARLKDIGIAEAGVAVKDGMKPFFGAGLAIIVAGLIAAFKRGLASAVIMVSLGVFVSQTGVVFVQYPWVALVMIPFEILALAGAAWVFRKEKALKDHHEAVKTLADVIEQVPAGQKIKAGIETLHPEAVETVRKVVRPIKAELGVAASTG